MSSLENLLKSTLKFVKAQLRKERGSIQFLQIVVPEKGTLFNISSPFSFCSSLWSLSNLLPRCRSTFTSTTRCLLGTWISRSLQFQLYLRGYMHKYIYQKSWKLMYLKINYLKVQSIKMLMAYDDHLPFEFKLWSSDCSFSPLVVPSKVSHKENCKSNQSI